jgi:hypothetical protein
MNIFKSNFTTIVYGHVHNVVVYTKELSLTRGSTVNIIYHNHCMLLLLLLLSLLHILLLLLLLFVIVGLLLVCYMLLHIPG